MYSVTSLKEMERELSDKVTRLETDVSSLSPASPYKPTLSIQEKISCDLREISSLVTARDKYLESLTDENKSLRSSISSLNSQVSSLSKTLSDMHRAPSTSTTGTTTSSSTQSKLTSHAPNSPKPAKPVKPVKPANSENSAKKASNGSKPSRVPSHQIPASISEDPALISAMSVLPSNYNFELPKTIWRLRSAENPVCSRVALQFPEGLLMYSCMIADIIEEFVPGVETVILGDVTYGACCIDDFTSNALECDFLVHYGHSCLVPITVTTTRVLYVFVDIVINVSHLCHTIMHNFPVPNRPLPPKLVKNLEKYKTHKSNGSNGSNEQKAVQWYGSNGSNASHGSKGDSANETHGRVAKHWRVILAGTIQFGTAVSESKGLLEEYYGAENVLVPQAKPLSPGEVLGCTSPILQFPNNSKGCCSSSSSPSSVGNDSCCKRKDGGCEEKQNEQEKIKIDNNEHGEDTILIFVADGRFHLESIMIANPSLKSYRYNPYDNKLTLERYDHDRMYSMRKNIIQKAKKATEMKQAKWGVILGTLGRQGNPNIVRRLCEIMDKKSIAYYVVLLSEIFNSKLCKFDEEEIKVWVQVGCPRLSIDWGVDSFEMILLNAYEATVALNEIEWKENAYPMDYYRQDGGIWSNYYLTEKEKAEKERKRKERRMERRKQLIAQRKARQFGQLGKDDTKGKRVTISYQN